MAHMIRNTLKSYQPLDERRGIGSLSLVPFQVINPGLVVAHEGLHMIDSIRSVTSRPEGTDIEVYLVRINQ